MTSRVARKTIFQNIAWRQGIQPIEHANCARVLVTAVLIPPRSSDSSASNSDSESYSSASSKSSASSAITSPILLAGAVASMTSVDPRITSITSG
mmetsp:Transcript_117233/g.250533  ORF Transcript_117233/g.250533 Transcript_117233/m.250533 type:complete len:95 (-) Transcript_117233:27-311(-)